MQNPPHDETAEFKTIENKQGGKIKNITFTQREWDILACIAAGSTVSKEIAQSLGISYKTVETHIAHILAKIRRHSRHHIPSFIKESGCQKELSDFYNYRLDGVLHQEPNRRFLTKEFWIRHKLRLAIVFMILCAGVGLTFSYRGVHSSPAKHMALKASPSHLLPRHDLMERLEKSLSQQKNPVVAIVGAGGVGKTTLARLYGQQSEAHIVFEINAEHAVSLTSSFIHLADQLIATPEQRATFQKIQSLQDETESMIQLASFVYGLLDEQPSWLLIFDNVDDIGAVRSFLPSQSQTQEKSAGQIIMTTRDQNIQNSSLISAVINVDELSPDEAFELFTRILKANKPSDNEKKAVQSFLSKIPSFPLDISLAAHYIRDAHLTFDQYLERLNRHQPTFHEHEKKLWQDVSDYPQTRYAIITLSTARMLEQNPQYLELLRMITLIDSQNIPVDLLRHTQDPSLVDPFIHALRTMSFMIGESDSHARHVFSIHRSTQTILHHYLKRTYGDPSVEATASALIQCAQHAMEEGDIITMAQLVPHFETLQISARDVVILPAPDHLSFYMTLGMLYYHTAHYEKAKHVLEDELQNKPSDEEKLKILIYLGNTYKELMETENARKAFEGGLSLYRQYFASNADKLIPILSSLAHIYRRLGDYKKTEEICTQCLDLDEKSDKKNDINRTKILEALCDACREQGMFERAESYAVHIIDLCRQHFKYCPLKHAHAINLLAHIKYDQGFYQEAIKLYEQTLAIYKENISSENTKVVKIYIKLSSLYRKTGHLDQSIEFLNKTSSTNPIVTAMSAYEHAYIAIQQNHYKEALDWAWKSHMLYAQIYGNQHIKTMRSLCLVGYVELLYGYLEKAEIHLKQALQTLENQQSYLMFQTLNYLSELYREKTMRSSSSKVSSDSLDQREAYYRQALTYIDQAISIGGTYFPPDSVHIAHLRKQRDRIVTTHAEGNTEENEALAKRCQ